MKEERYPLLKRLPQTVNSRGPRKQKKGKTKSGTVFGLLGSNTILIQEDILLLGRQETATSGSDTRGGKTKKRHGEESSDANVLQIKIV